MSKPSERQLSASELLETHARIASLPEEAQGQVRAAFSDLIKYRVYLLDHWRQVPRQLRRVEAVKVARAWMSKARVVSALYPCLTQSCPLPRVLDSMVAVLEKGVGPGQLAALVLDLEHLQLDQKAAARLAEQVAVLAQGAAHES